LLPVGYLATSRLLQHAQQATCLATSLGQILQDGGLFEG